MSDSRDRQDATEQREVTEQGDDSRELRAATEQPDATLPKTGGFGAFSRQYRDRWAANHPGSRRIHGDAASSDVTPIGAARKPRADVEGRDAGGGSAKKP